MADHPSTDRRTRRTRQGGLQTGPTVAEVVEKELREAAAQRAIRDARRREEIEALEKRVAEAPARAEPNAAPVGARTTGIRGEAPSLPSVQPTTPRRREPSYSVTALEHINAVRAEARSAYQQDLIERYGALEPLAAETPSLADARDRIEDQLASYFIEPEVAFARITDSFYVNGADETINQATYSPEVFGDVAPEVDTAELMDQVPMLADQIRRLNELQLQLDQAEIARDAAPEPRYQPRTRAVDNTATRLEEITTAHNVTYSLDERRARLISARNEVRAAAHDLFVPADAQRFIRNLEDTSAVELRALAAKAEQLEAAGQPRDFSQTTARRSLVQKPAPEILEQLDQVPSSRGPLTYLSNVYPAPVTLDGERYPSVEHAFAAAKTLDPAIRAEIRNEPSAATAKQIGGRLELREDWDAIKHGVMNDLLQQKFSNPTLRARLLATGDAPLIEQNNWGDQYWGVAKGTGENHLGHLLSQIRAAYQQQTLERTNVLAAALPRDPIDVPRVRMTGGRAQTVTTGPAAGADFIPKHGLVMAGTGHRPDKITLPDGTNAFRSEAFVRLVDFATQVVERERPAFGISGMASGWDQALAEAFERTGTPWAAAVPFEGQEKAWPKEAQKRYHDLLAKADHVHIVSSGSYERWMLDERNQWMVDNSTAMAALWNGSNGGTRNALDYAATAKTPALNLWDEWQTFSERPGQTIDSAPKLPALLEERGLSTRMPAQTKDEALSRLQNAVQHAADTQTRYDLAHSRAAAALGTPALRESEARLIGTKDAFIQQSLRSGLEPDAVRTLMQAIERTPDQTPALIDGALRSVRAPEGAARELNILTDQWATAREAHANVQRLASGQAPRHESGRFIEQEVERRQSRATAERRPAAVNERRLTKNGGSMPHRRPLDCISCGAPKLGSNRGRDLEGHRLDVEGNRIANPETVDKERLKPAGERDHGLCKTCFESNGPLAPQKLSLATHTTALEASILHHTNDQPKNLRPAEQQLREQQWQALAEQTRARYAALYPLGIDPNLGLNDGPLANVERIDRFAEQLDNRGAYEEDGALDYLVDNDNAFDDFDRHDAFIEAIEDRWLEGQLDVGIGDSPDTPDTFKTPEQLMLDRTALDATRTRAREAIDAVRGEADTLLKSSLVDRANSRFQIAANTNLRHAFDKTLSIDPVEARTEARERLIDRLNSLDRSALRNEIKQAQGYTNPFMTPEQRATAIEQRVSTILSAQEAGLGVPNYNGYTFRGPDESFGRGEMTRALTAHQQRIANFLEKNQQSLEDFERTHGVLNPTREIISSAQEVRPGVTLHAFQREARDQEIAAEIATAGHPTDERIRAAFDDYLANIEELGRRGHAPFPEDMPDLIEQTALANAGFTPERMAYLEDAERIVLAAQEQGIRATVAPDVAAEIAEADRIIEPYRAVYAEYHARFESELAAKQAERALAATAERTAAERVFATANHPVQAVHQGLAAVQQHEQLTRQWNDTVRRGDETKQLRTALENAAKTEHAAHSTLKNRLANVYTKPDAVLDALNAATPEQRVKMIEQLRGDPKALDAISPLRNPGGRGPKQLAELDRNTRATAVLMDSYHHAKSGSEATHLWAAKHLDVDPAMAPAQLLEHVNTQYTALREHAIETRDQLTALGTPPTAEMLRERIHSLSPAERAQLGTPNGLNELLQRAPQVRAKTPSLAL